MSFLAQSDSEGQSMEEEQEDDDSIENELENFRQEWKSEVTKKKQGSVPPPEITTSEDNSSLISKAQDLFQQGVDCERNGDLYDAVRFYKKAFQLVPDIERKTFDASSARSSKEPFQSRVEELEADFSKSVSISPGSLRITVPGGEICEAAFVQDETHLSALPGEVLVLIFRWLVSDELDVHSLEIASTVCKGFYVASRSPVLWKSICSRTWGPGNIRGPPNNWREYFLRKPRVLPFGCYISKTTYMREGEKGFQDECYRAWHIVHYYRYIRFFASGMVAMAITSDAPGSVLGCLKQCIWPPPIQGMLYGRYRVMKNKVACILLRKPESNMNRKTKGSKKKDFGYVAPEQEMHIEFEIKGRKNRVLEWTRYFIVSKYANGSEKANEVDTSNLSQYPNLAFSSVMSYFGLSNAPV